MILITFAWWLSAAILAGWYLVVFRPRLERKAYEEPRTWPGVSMIIPVRNGASLLREHLPLFLAQEYPSFEIIIVDDHNTTEERMQLEKLVFRFEKVSLMHNTGPQGKRWALESGIFFAKNEMLLLTDADCRVPNPKWMKQMVGHAQNNKVVLGYAPYLKVDTVLNAVIRFETLMTAMQYGAWAMMGKAFMGVGRNMLVPKSLFSKNKDTSDKSRLPFGDDDVMVQRAIKEKMKVGVCFHPDAFVYSEAANTWKAWWRQKHRHMTGAYRYNLMSMILPGVFSLALICNWLLLIPAMFIGYFSLTLFVFAIGLFLRWWIVSMWAARLDEKDLMKRYPLFEVVYCFYLAGMGLFALFKRKKTWN